MAKILDFCKIIIMLPYTLIYALIILIVHVWSMYTNKGEKSQLDYEINFGDEDNQ